MKKLDRRSFIKSMAAVSTAGIASSALSAIADTDEKAKKLEVSRHDQVVIAWENCPYVEHRAHLWLSFELAEDYGLSPSSSIVNIQNKFVDALFFPVGTTVLNAKPDFSFARIEIIIAHPDLQVVCDGCVPVLIKPVFARTNGIPHFESWGFRW